MHKDLSFIMINLYGREGGREGGSKQGGREGGRGDRRGQRDRGQDQETTAHNMSQKE